MDARANDGSTALFTAIGLGQLESAKLLLDAGADPNMYTKDGETPFVRAMAAETFKLPVAKLLLEAGAVAPASLGGHA